MYLQQNDRFMNFRVLHLKKLANFIWISRSRGLFLAKQLILWESSVTLRSAWVCGLGLVGRQSATTKRPSSSCLKPTTTPSAFYTLQCKGGKDQVAEPSTVCTWERCQCTRGFLIPIQPSRREGRKQMMMVVVVEEVSLVAQTPPISRGGSESYDLFAAYCCCCLLCGEELGELQIDPNTGYGSAGSWLHKLPVQLGAF